jgi:hypothetical protein
LLHTGPGGEAAVAAHFPVIALIVLITGKTNILE